MQVQKFWEEIGEGSVWDEIMSPQRCACVCKEERASKCKEDLGAGRHKAKAGMCGEPTKAWQGLSGRHGAQRQQIQQARNHKARTKHTRQGTRTCLPLERDRKKKGQ